MRGDRANVDGARMAALDAVTASCHAPFAVVDLDAFDANADDLARRAAGTPIRVATKSVRCRALLERALAHPGFAGVLAFSLDEALWLCPELPEPHDILVAYPCVDAALLERLAASRQARRRIALVVDDPVHLRMLERALAVVDDEDARIRVWLDVDCSLRIGPAHLGARRSPLHEPAQVAAAARALAASPRLDLGGVMFYDAQIAGLADAGAHIRIMQRASSAELARRRAAVVAEVARVGDIPAVNAGGTGSLHLMSGPAEVTELAAGSGLLGPHLFDRYRAFTPRPACFYATQVVRHPAPRFATVFAGGYPASGAAGADRSPRPWWPAGLALVGAEGAGEVQTPLRARAGVRVPAIGERVWFRHAKAGEALERFDAVHLVAGERAAGIAATYRGEGRCFG